MFLERLVDTAIFIIYPLLINYNGAAGMGMDWVVAKYGPIESAVCASQSHPKSLQLPINVVLRLILNSVSSVNV